MTTYLLKPGHRQIIGKAGEREDTAVAINVSAWLTEYPDGRGQIMVTAPNGTRVPLVAEVSDSLLTAAVPETCTMYPGLYTYTAVWTMNGAQVLSVSCECMIMESELAKTWKPHTGAPDWAERIFVAAEVIENSMGGTIQARDAAAQMADNAAASAGEAAGSADEAETQAGLASGYAEAAAASSQIVADSVETLQTLRYGLLNSKQTVYTGFSGDGTSAGKWVQTGNENYKFTVFTLSAGDRVSIRTTKPNLVIGFLTAFDGQPADSDTVHYAEAEGFTGRISIIAPTEAMPMTGRDLVAPAGSTHLYVQLYRNAECAPDILTINGTEYFTPGVELTGRKNRDGVSASNILPLADRQAYFGFISTNNTWNTDNSKYMFKYVPCAPGSSVQVTAPSNTVTYIAALTDEPVANIYTAVPVSGASGWNKRIAINAGSDYTGTAPDDTKYLYIQVMYNAAECAPVSVKIDGVEFTGTVYDNLGADRKLYEERFAGVEQDIGETAGKISGYNIPLTWESGTFTATAGSPLTPLARNSKKRTAGNTLRYPYPLTLTTTELDGVLFNTRLLFVDENDNYTVGFGANLLTKSIPANQGFRIAIELSSNPNEDISGYSSEYINARVTLHAGGVREAPPKWAALGDSITEGHCSIRTWNESTQSYDVQRDISNRAAECWAQLMAVRSGWNLTNRAIGGTGFIYWQGGSRTADMAGFRVARATDFSKFDLVTVAFGINDWKGNVPIGNMDSPYGSKGEYNAQTGLYTWEGEPTTIYGGIRAVIEAVMATGQNCKLVVMTPLNALGYSGEYKNSPQYARTYNYTNSGTLDDVAEAIKEVCDYYGVECIDMTSGSCVNLCNIESALPDGVHPSLEIHSVLARELEKKISYS